MTDYDLTYLSFGAGVQSTAMLALAVLGERRIPKPDVAIYADTQSELPDTDEHVRRMAAWCAERGVPLHVETAGSLEAAQLGLQASRGSGYTVSIPAFTTDGGMLRRQCTRHHKLDVILAAVRKILGFGKGERIAGRKRVRAMIGISTDEADRMTTSKVSWIDNTYPLIDAGMARWDCVDEIARLGLPVPPKSSCVFCPYHSDEHWDWMKRERPESFARAVAVDEAIRVAVRHGDVKPGFLHSRRLPLAGLDFEAMLRERRAQGQLFPDASHGAFRNECEGMCGV